jgi:hypothetical protein
MVITNVGGRINMRRIGIMRRNKNLGSNRVTCTIIGYDSSYAM